MKNKNETLENAVQEMARYHGVSLEDLSPKEKEILVWGFKAAVVFNKNKRNNKAQKGDAGKFVANFLKRHGLVSKVDIPKTGKNGCQIHIFCSKSENGGVLLYQWYGNPRCDARGKTPWTPVYLALRENLPLAVERALERWEQRQTKNETSQEDLNMLYAVA